MTKYMKMDIDMVELDTMDKIDKINRNVYKR